MIRSMPEHRLLMHALPLLGVLVWAGEGAASAGSAAELSADEIAIDQAVCRDYIRVDAWNAVWTVTFAVAAVGSAGVAALAPSGWIESDSRAGLYVTAAKASIGAVARLIDPLEIDATGLCRDSHPASTRRRQAALAEAAHRQQGALLLNLVGGLTINTAGLLYLGYGRGAWKTAWFSFGVGTAVAVTSTLTAPIHSWLLERRRSHAHQLAVVPIIGVGGGLVSLAGKW
jgi:hypothetical protein